MTAEAQKWDIAASRRVQRSISRDIQTSMYDFWFLWRHPRSYVDDDDEVTAQEDMGKCIFEIIDTNEDRISGPFTSRSRWMLSFSSDSR
jgi:hypothetical protein